MVTPEVAVGLGQHQRHPPDHGRQPDRAGHIAAGAEHRRGAQLPSSLRACLSAVVSTAAARGRAQRLAAVQRLHLQRVQLVPRGRHQLELGALAADERDVGAVSSQRVRDRDRRNDVTGGPAGADHERRRSHRLPAAVSPPVGRC